MHVWDFHIVAARCISYIFIARTVMRFHEQRPIAGDRRAGYGGADVRRVASNRIVRFGWFAYPARYTAIRAVLVSANSSACNAGACLSDEIVRVRRSITKLGTPDQHAPDNRFISGLICWREKENVSRQPSRPASGSEPWETRAEVNAQGKTFD